jgi:hypothetical protein
VLFWECSVLRSERRDFEVEACDKLSDAAKTGDWATVWTMLCKGGVNANTVRMGGKSLYSPLHQAAWRCESAQIVRQLLDFGAYRTLHNADGERPIDLAGRRGAYHLVPDLRPRPKHELEDWVLYGLENQLHRHIRKRLKDILPDARLRMPQIGPLTEETEPKMEMLVSGLYGGFTIELTGEKALTVKSSSRVFDGWGETWEITPGQARRTTRDWDM